jgi:hypothetical protein
MGSEFLCRANTQGYGFIHIVSQEVVDKITDWMSGKRDNLRSKGQKALGGYKSKKAFKNWAENEEEMQDHTWSWKESHRRNMVLSTRTRDRRGYAPVVDTRAEEVDPRLRIRGEHNLQPSILSRTPRSCLAESSMASTAFVIIFLKDPAISQLGFPKRHMAAREVSSTTSLGCVNILTSFWLFA